MSSTNDNGVSSVKTTPLMNGHAHNGAPEVGLDGQRSRPTVALIGCGPSGMFFLHALATKRRDLQNSNDTDGLARLPFVTCYERADAPGGIWRSTKEGAEGESVSEEMPPRIYDCLWSNGPKEAIEFADYTFREHFGGRSVPTYLPRGDLFEYLMERTTSVDADLFDAKAQRTVRFADEEIEGGYDDGIGEEEKKHAPSPESSLADEETRSAGCGEGKGERLHQIRFNTVVQSVSYNESTAKFEVTSAPRSSRCVATKDSYDYCIWAGGRNGKPRIPRALLKLLRTGGTHTDDVEKETEEAEPVPFKGTILHSCYMSNFNDAVRGKRIVLIGDSSSAEDLALHAVKQGVDMCYILSRSGFGDCVYTGSWPGVLNPDTGEVVPKVEVHVAMPYCIIENGTGLKCNTMVWNDEDDVYEIDESSEPTSLRNIDTVIFCTGYVANQDCLGAELKFDVPSDDEFYWSVPPDFRMRPNPFTPEIGEIEPCPELDLSGNVLPHVFRTVRITNPRMMYLIDQHAEYPLLELDVAAWLCLAFITGEATVPSQEEMEAAVHEQMVEEMHIPYLRWCMDINYFDALNELGDDHWSDDYEDQRTVEMNEQYARYFTGVLARDMRNAKYPVDIGGFDALNKKGEEHVQIEMQNLFARHLLNAAHPDAAWKTFRDADPRPFRSMHTGQVAAPLPGHWLDLDKDGVPTSFSNTE